MTDPLDILWIVRKNVGHNKAEKTLQMEQTLPVEDAAMPLKDVSVVLRTQSCLARSCSG
jgi:hypothetical protein